MLAGGFVLYSSVYEISGSLGRNNDYTIAAVVIGVGAAMLIAGIWRWFTLAPRMESVSIYWVITSMVALILLLFVLQHRSATICHFSPGISRASLRETSARACRSGNIVPVLIVVVLVLAPTGMYLIWRLQRRRGSL